MKLSLHALLFCSGAVGLAYEICWSRQLAAWLGHGERAAALTLALFFLGMAGGYALAARSLSRKPTRPERPLRAYAACELLIAGCALCVPWLNQYQGLHAHLWLALLPPALAMGASLPFIMQTVAATGASVSRAYAFHLLGATLGSFVTTFFLIERLGLWNTTYCAAALSFGCGAVAWCLHERKDATVHTQLPSAWRYQLAAAWVGAATLALEVLVMRLFALTFNNSTYTFGLTLSVFIVFLALGSRWASKHDEPNATVRTPARAATFAAAGVACIVPLFSATTRFGEMRAPDFTSYMLLATGLVAFVLALPVIAAGALLPALWSAAHGKAGHTVGTLSAANSLGAAAGALFASFVLLPALGLLHALTCVSFAYALLWLAFTGVSRWTLPMLGALLALASLSPEPSLPEGYTLLQRWQSPYGWVDLLRSRRDQALSVRVDLHYQLGSSADRPRHLSMGSLPLALHAKPSRVLFIGLATGMTASAALSVPSLKAIEVVELIPEVAHAARRFAAFNQNLLDQPRVHLTFDDGRAYMRRDASPFDVIVSDLFVPWHSHAGYLYTVEHYRAVRARLSASGLFAQWLPLGHLGSEELELIGASLSSVFPITSVWINDDDPSRAMLAIVGHKRAQTLPTHFDRARLLGPFKARPNGLLNSDEYPRVEFQAPRTERAQQLLKGQRLRAYLAQRFGPQAVRTP